MPKERSFLSAIGSVYAFLRPSSKYAVRKSQERIDESRRELMEAIDRREEGRELVFKYNIETIEKNFQFKIPVFTDVDCNLLEGKSSKGFYFDHRRCPNCGHLHGQYGNAFAFCSDECLEAVTKKNIENEYKGEFTDSSVYANLEKQAAAHDMYPSDGLDVPAFFRNRDYLSDTFYITKKQKSLEAIQRFIDKWNAERSLVLSELKQKYQQEQQRIHDEQQALQDQLTARPIPNDKFFEHVHILGPSGSGKTTLIQHHFFEFTSLEDPPAMVIIDPKGELAKRLPHLDVFNPDTGRLRDRLVVIDPADSPALNMFHPASRWNRMYSDNVRQQLEQRAISAFTYIFQSTNEALTSKQKVPFSFVASLMFEMNKSPNKGADLLTFLDLMDDQANVKLPPQQKAQQSHFASFIDRLDPISQRFFKNDFYSSNYAETRQQIKSRINGLLRRPELRNIFLTPERRIDLFDCLQQRKIVLVNTGRPIYGAESSQLIGRFFISLTLQAAFERYAIPRDQWNPAYLIIDEFQDFADEEQTPDLLRLAREYKLGVFLAHQNMYCPELNDNLRNAISTNTSVKFAASPEGQDTNYVARDLRCDPDFLRSQTVRDGNANFACFVRGMLQHPMAISVAVTEYDQQPKMTEEQHRRLLWMNQARVQAGVNPPLEPKPKAEPDVHKPASDRLHDNDRLW